MRCLLIILSLLPVLLSSCKTQQNTIAEKELIVPCDCMENKNGNEIICVSAVSESKDQMLSKRIALSDARIELAALTKTYILNISNRFSDSKNTDTAESFEIKRQEATRQVTDITLTDMSITCEKVMVTKSGTYKTYVRIEMSKKAIDNRIQENTFFKTLSTL